MIRQAIALTEEIRGKGLSKLVLSIKGIAIRVFFSYRENRLGRPKVLGNRCRIWQSLEDGNIVVCVLNCYSDRNLRMKRRRTAVFGLNEQSVGWSNGRKETFH